MRRNQTTAFLWAIVSLVPSILPAQDLEHRVTFTIRPTDGFLSKYHLSLNPGTLIVDGVPEATLDELRQLPYVPSDIIELSQGPHYARFGLQRGNQLAIGRYSYFPESEAPIAKAVAQSSLSYAVIEFRTKRQQDSAFEEWVDQNGHQDFLEMVGARQFVVSKESADKIEKKNLLQWKRSLHPWLKIGRGIRKYHEVAVFLRPDLLKGQGLGALQQRLATFGAVMSTLCDHCDELTLRIDDLDKLAGLAEIEEVARIEPQGRIDLRNSTTSWVMQTNCRPHRSLFEHGIHGENQVIGLIDDGLDAHHCFFLGGQRKLRSYFGAPSPKEREAGFHGTYVAGIAAGEDAENPGFADNGQAPAATIVFTELDELRMTYLRNRLQEQYDHGADARIFSESWGDDEKCVCDGKDFSSHLCSYGTWAYQIDRFMRENEDALVINAVSNGDEVTVPENAKNSLAVGASKQADEQEMKGSGGHGPTCDGRRKPELFVPGCRIRTAEARTRCDIEMARSEGSEAMCATSWAAPAVAGAAALVREYLSDVSGFHGSVVGQPQPHCSPTGALVKSVLLNAGDPMKEYSDCPYPNNVQGWGRVRLNGSVVFDDQSRRIALVDRSNKYGFQNDWHCDFFIVSSKGDFRATLAWTDAVKVEANLRGKFLTNDLDLIVFDFARWQVHGGRDHVNNVEQVRIKDGVGDYAVIVRSRSINWDRQGYALAVTGDDLTLNPFFYGGPFMGCSTVEPKMLPQFICLLLPT